MEVSAPLALTIYSVSWRRRNLKIFFSSLLLNLQHSGSRSIGLTGAPQALH